jgi:hypothetical protein
MKNATIAFTAACLFAAVNLNAGTIKTTPSTDWEIEVEYIPTDFDFFTASCSLECAQDWNAFYGNEDFALIEAGLAPPYSVLRGPFEVDKPSDPPPPDTTVTPEPATTAMLLMALACAVGSGIARRKRG